MIMNRVMDKIIGELYAGSCRLDDFIGLGCLIKYNEPIDENRSTCKKIEDAQSYYLTTTDNRIELLAAIYGLQSVIDNIVSQELKLDQVNFYTTSKYLYNAFSRRWIHKWKANNWMKSGWNGLPPRPIKNSDLWEQLIICKEKLEQMGVDLLLHFVPNPSSANYRVECINKANQLAHKAAEEAFNMKEEYYDKLFYELYGDILNNPDWLYST